MVKDQIQLLDCFASEKGRHFFGRHFHEELITAKNRKNASWDDILKITGRTIDFFFYPIWSMGWIKLLLKMHISGIGFSLDATEFSSKLLCKDMSSCNGLPSSSRLVSICKEIEDVLFDYPNRSTEFCECFTLLGAA